MAIQKCPKCSYLEKNKDAQYCMHCGVKLLASQAMEVFLCPKCNKALNKPDHYCPGCGERRVPFCSHCGVKGTLVYQEIPEENYTPSVPDSKLKPIDVKKQLEQAGKKSEEFAYPNDILLEKQTMDEGFYHTTRNRQIQKFIYKSQATVEQMEDHYRNLYPGISIIRFVDDILKTPGLILKPATKEKEIVEITLYTFINYPKEDWNAIHKKIQAKLQEEMKPVAQLEKEMANLEKMIREGKTTVSKSQDLQEDLKKRMKLATNSKSYWQLYAKEKVCLLGHNIVLIHFVSSK